MKISRPPPNPAPKHEPGPTRRTDGNDMLLRSKKRRERTRGRTQKGRDSEGGRTSPENGGAVTPAQ